MTDTTLLNPPEVAAASAPAALTNRQWPGAPGPLNEKHGAQREGQRAVPKENGRPASTRPSSLGTGKSSRSARPLKVATDAATVCA